MRRWHLVAALAAVLFWGLLTPVAMAFNPCMAMALCEDPCGAIPSALSPRPDVVAVIPVSEELTFASEHVVAVALSVAEPPPRLSSFSA